MRHGRARIHAHADSHRLRIKEDCFGLLLEERNPLLQLVHRSVDPLVALSKRRVEFPEGFIVLTKLEDGVLRLKETEEQAVSSRRES